MHLSTIEKPWGKSYTNKRYVHPPFAENIITAWPNSTVMIGEITSGKNADPHSYTKTKEFPNSFGGELPSAGVVFTLKRESDLKFRQRERKPYRKYMWTHDLMPSKGTTHKTRKDGVPIHGIVKKMDYVNFYQEVFCDTQRVSTAYIKVTVENAVDAPQTVELGALVRTGTESLFTGCLDPDGYDGYFPTRSYWEEKVLKRYKRKDGYFTDGTYRLYFDQKEKFSFDSENDLNIVLKLKPKEKKTFTFAFTRNKNMPKAYNTARKETENFWKKELGKAKNIPDKKGIESLFYNFLAQMLQMFAKPHGEEYTIMRQGATQRYHWPEAKEMVKALAHIGGYSDYIDAGLAHYFNDLQEKEGENTGRIHYKYVPWNTRTSAALEMFADAVADDDAVFDRYIEQAMLGFRWLESERSKSAKIEGAVPGLLPPGIATDHHIGTAQQWTFADTGVLRGYEYFYELLKQKGSPYCAEVEAAYKEYFNILKGIFERFAKEQKDSEFLYLPRDPKNDPEIEASLNQDAFYYMFPNEALAMGLGGYGSTDSEKVIYTYSCADQAKNGLIYPTYRSTTGVGRTWYTTWSEHSRYIYYKRSGNRKECKKLIDALLKYNVTTEYCQGERYDDHDAYTTPWMPNASANGRLLDMLFDYYGKRNLK